MAITRPTSAEEDIPNLTRTEKIESIDLRAASRLTGLQTEVIVELIRAEIVMPLEPGRKDLRFDESGLIRLRRIAGLQRREAHDHQALGIILDLMERLERAEEELRFLRE